MIRDILISLTDLVDSADQITNDKTYEMRYNRLSEEIWTIYFLLPQNKRDVAANPCRYIKYRSLTK